MESRPEAGAHELLYVRATSRASRMGPLVVLGLLAARRGDRDAAWRLLDEARDHVRDARVLDYDGVIAAARGEAHLLEDDIDRVETDVRPAFEEALRVRDEEFLSSLTLVLWRAGLLTHAPDGISTTARLSISGRHREASTGWLSQGFPYHAAWALLDSDDEVDLREARAMFDRLGVSVLVDRTDAKLRTIGAKVPRGARASTRARRGICSPCRPSGKPVPS